MYDECFLILQTEIICFHSENQISSQKTIFVFITKKAFFIY